MLNDLFGIQSRGGCSCAGPYGHRLLGIDLDRSHEFEREITRGCEGIKPGWVRVNFNYFIDDETFEYLLAAEQSGASREFGASRHLSSSGSSLGSSLGSSRGVAMCARLCVAASVALGEARAASRPEPRGESVNGQ